MKRLAARALLLAVLASSQAALALPTPEDQQRAGESFRQAEAAFARKEYAAAAAAFEQAAAFAPHPTAFLNAAEAWELAGDPVRAAQACARARSVPDAAPSFVAEAERRLKALAPRVVTLDLVGPPGSRARVDGGPEVLAPTTVFVAAGDHFVSVVDAAGGTARAIPVSVLEGARVRVDVSSAGARRVDPPSTGPAGPDPPAEVEPASGVEVPVATWVSFGVAGAAAVAMGVFGGLTIAAQGDFEVEPTRENADRFHDYRLTTNVLIGVASAAAAVGAVVWIVDAATREPAKPRAAVSLGVRPGAAGGAVLLGF